MAVFELNEESVRESSACARVIECGSPKRSYLTDRGGKLNVSETLTDADTETGIDLSLDPPLVRAVAIGHCCLWPRSRIRSRRPCHDIVP
jgi:hypothetical protein